MKKISRAYLRMFLTIKVKQILNTLPFYTHTKYSIFLIVSHPRTGSSLLHTLLNSHTQILSLNEPISQTTDLNKLLKAYSKKIKTVGFKYFYEYTEDADKKKLLIDLLIKPNIKIIKMHRKNVLRVYVSLRIAQKTNAWSSTDSGKSSIVNKKVELTKEECLQAFIQFEKWEELTSGILKKHTLPIFETTYETLVQQPNETLFAIQKFLGVDREVPSSLLQRQNAENLKDLIGNYDALEQSFIGTKYQQFFEE